ncbi:PREDICTED: SH3 domain-containing RING finger protein 3-like isoform X2 [Nicrophorus vespilloides]|uniref:RING-type E3 ubiquitin transferase n=1 Tax=Nicrophorus vespilloides TaxID=110193 RepID=A0ABM1MVE0_NICVS|nr:PREDICTED: SH3 domain-containing RING finger protein 3-like isoform X2 [Nicrophorus vespilloides]
MDEGTLNDLLECSVCLERLDTSSKVLPCQHTFCKKCLNEIVESHKELRCPECRILVPIKVDELPPNVLLMRLLEGMRNAAPKKVHRNNAHNAVPNAVPMAPMQQQQQHHHHHHSTFNHRHKSNKQLTPLAPHQAYAKALYNFISKEPGDLNFKRDEIIMLRKRVDSYWYEGECGGKKGVFPINFVQIITPVPSNIPQCKALYDFRMTNDEEEGCLVFNKGDIITVIRRVDENWAEGKLDGRIGIFPLAFVELNNLARSLMKLSTNAQPGPSRVAPPTPTTEDSAPLIPTDHSRTMGSVHLAQPNTPKHVAGNPPAAAAGLPTSDSSSTVSSGTSSTTTTPNTSSSNTSSSSSTAPSSPASPPTRAAAVNRAQKHDQGMVSTPQRQPPPAHLSPHQSREKRHSFTSLTVPQQPSSTYRHSAEILCTEGAESASPVSERHRRNLVDTIQLPAAYIALYPYKPQKADELELRKGGIYTVTEKCQDGWFKGTSNRTQKSGVFPGNYVTPASAPRSPQTQNSSDSKSAVSYTRSKGGSRNSNLPPELPPRSTSPNAISSSWHGQQDNTAAPLGRSSSAALMSTVNLTLTYSKASEKPKERKEKSSSSTVGMMKRLASFKRSKSPPPPSYSMDNPVFEDAAVSSTSTLQPVHVRSGSCPSQLLQVQPMIEQTHRMFQSTSQRLKHKERASILAHSPRSEPQPSSNSATSSPNVHHHRKSHSLDAGNKAKTGTQTVRERFRCIAPYPPNSEYELELQVNDIIYVHKKRDDGWYKGTQQRTGRTGLFPASFVESY